MQDTMDTDYGLPVVMHRPFIDLNPDHDSPLPFRKDLARVTELNAENSTPYQLPKARQVSRLEQLPLGIRMKIYEYCNLFDRLDVEEPNRLYFFRYTDGWEVVLFYGSCVPEHRHSLLYVGRQLQAELLDYILRDATAKFEFSLSDRKIFWNNWDNYYSSSYIPPKVERVALGTLSFQYMRRVQLEFAGCS